MLDGRSIVGFQNVVVLFRRPLEQNKKIAIVGTANKTKIFHLGKPGNGFVILAGCTFQSKGKKSNGRNKPSCDADGTEQRIDVGVDPKPCGDLHPCIG